MSYRIHIYAPVFEFYFCHYLTVEMLASQLIFLSLIFFTSKIVLVITILSLLWAWNELRLVEKYFAQKSFNFLIFFKSYVYYICSQFYFHGLYSMLFFIEVSVSLRNWLTLVRYMLWPVLTLIFCKK